MINIPDDIKYDIPEYSGGKGLEVGGKTFPHHIGVANSDLDLFDAGVFDFVFGHDEELEISAYWRVIRNGGCLIIVSKDSPEHPAASGWDLAVKRTRPDYHYRVYRKIDGAKKSFSFNDPKPEKVCAVIRYGGFGDMIQASSILPALKAQGYHITVHTSKGGHAVVRNDPNIDKLIIQYTDQVPNQELSAFWAYQATKYDKFINLSETVEGTILALPGRTNHRWPKRVREKYLKINYYQFLHDLADVPMPPKPAFYPTVREVERAMKKLHDDDGSLRVMWVLSGSSVHKTWPYLDQALARLLVTFPNIRIYLSGDDLCQVLEAGWQDESRVICRSGAPIRETLVMAQLMDVVIGPETGVLNAVAMEKDVAKIMFHSHAPPECNSIWWNNASALYPENCDCYPCHQLHYGFEYCARDEETGTAKCQAMISVDQFERAFKRAVGPRRTG